MPLGLFTLSAAAGGVLVLHVKRLGFGGGERAAAFKDGRGVAVEKFLQFRILHGDWICDGVEDDGGGDDSHYRTFCLRAILVHLGGARFVVDYELHCLLVFILH